VAGWTCCLVKIYGTKADVLFWWTLRGFAAVFWVGGVVCFDIQFTLGLPRWQGTGHGVVILLFVKKKKFEVIKGSKSIAV
jgi:hypothetical protein